MHNRSGSTSNSLLAPPNAQEDILYDSLDPEHQARQHTIFNDITGSLRIPSAVQGTRVSEPYEFRKPFYITPTLLAACKSHSMVLMRYKGALQEPRWLDVEGLIFHAISAIDQLECYKIEFDIIVSFGPTELKAYTSWKEKGVEMRRLATIVYE